MEDYILREIDRIGEMLVKIARRMSSWTGGKPRKHLAESPRAEKN